MTDTPIKVLLFEDNPGDARLVQEALTEGSSGSQRFDVELVGDLGKGLERLTQGGVDVVLTDLGLPDCIGLEAFEKLHSQFPALPIIILTGTYEDEMLAREAIQKGAQDYLIKGSVGGFILQRSIQYAVERKKLDQMKESFVHTVSHEFRTPLTIIKAALENLNEGLLGTLSTKQSETVQTSIRGADRLTRMMNNILDLSRLESGRGTPQRKIIDMKFLIQEAVQDVNQYANGKNINLQPELPENLPTLSADPDMVGEVLHNLIDNALRFAKKNVTIRASQKDLDVLVTIIDDGPGIPEDNIKDLFEKFAQVNRPTGGGGYKGTGLGLAICKDIIELHQGKIWAENTGGGAAFCFTLPLG